MPSGVCNNNNTDTSKKEDNTTATGKLPQTGEGSFIIMIITGIALICISFFLYKKVVFYKDI